MENIPIPMLSNNGEDIQASETTVDSTPNTEEPRNVDVFLRIDFSGLGSGNRSRVEEDMDRSRFKLAGKVRELQHEMEIIKNPNFKVQ